MKKYVPITRRQKLWLILFGLFLTLILLETGLRLSGGIITSYYHHKQPKLRVKTNKIRILCLGESTTARAYPPVLQRWLDAHDRPGKFQVIDRGVYATNSAVIASKIEEYLNEINPHIVISMIGANDTWDTIKFQDTVAQKGLLSLSQIRIYKLWKLLIDHVQLALSKDRLLNQEKHKDSKDSGEIKQVADPQGLNQQQLADAKKYIILAKYDSARDCLGMLSDTSLADVAVYELARIDIEETLYDDAAQKLHLLLDKDNKNTNYYYQLSRAYRGKERDDLAETIYKKWISLEPDESSAYYLYGILLKSNKRIKEAIGLFEMGVEKSPQESIIYNQLGACYRKLGWYEKAVLTYKKALEKQPKNVQILSALAVCYLDSQQIDQAQPYFNKVKQVMLEHYNPNTAYNYKYIRDKVLAYGSVLVCMQYPFQPVEPLKKIVGKQDRIIFVSNEMNFTEALKSYKYSELFSDSFGGSFGHTTPAGDKIMARHLGQIILEDWEKQILN